MLNALQAYQFEENPVRVVMVEDEPWFVASDVSGVLGYRMAPDMTRNLDDDERGTHIVRTPSGDQSMTIISESGLYAAIFKSRREEAQRFRRWVTGEVLPAIRKTGRYTLHDPLPPEAPTLEDGDVGLLNAKLSIMKEARFVWGREECRSIWMKIGLPSPIAEAAAVAIDELATALARALDGRDWTTMKEAALLIGAALDTRLQMRLAEALHLLGFKRGHRRVDGAVQRGWERTRAAIAAPAVTDAAEA